MHKITLEEYVMGRDVLFPDEWVLAKANACLFLEHVNSFFDELAYDLDMPVSSGFRPVIINSKIPKAAKQSLHSIGKAIDLFDDNNEFKKRFRPLMNRDHSELLRKHGLFMEHPDYTMGVSNAGWLHLDQGSRLDRVSRCFVP